MKRRHGVTSGGRAALAHLLLALGALAAWETPAGGESGPKVATAEGIPLPPPRLDGGISVEQALGQRRTTREFTDAPLALGEVAQLLWAAQGITGPRGFRTAPSAGALYPLEIYVAAGRVKGLDPGVYKYRPQGHRLTLIARGDKRSALARAALGQPWIRDNAAVLVFAAEEKRTTGKYGSRGVRYVHIEVGHAAQNVFLQATALGLGAAVVGAFRDSDVEKTVRMPKEERALYLMPVGRPLQ